MVRYIKGHLLITFLAILLMSFAGCGDGGYSTESRLGISVTDPSMIQSDIVEETDDFGTDGEANTNDPNGSEGNNRPDPGEEITVPLDDDTMTVTFTNKLREGSEAGGDIRLNEFIITYYDQNGLTPTYAPQKRNVMTGIVEPGGTLTFEFVIVDLEMKTGKSGVLGLRDLFLYYPSQFDDTLYAQIDFYGRDVLNNEPAVAVVRITILFSNYI